MSLYNMVIPTNLAAGSLFAAIGLDPAIVPRARDVWINRALTEVTVFTRTGGGNRGEYAEANGLLRSHPGFLRDRDWGMDSTYAEWVFAVPEDRSAVLREDIEARSAEDQAVIYRVITADATAKWNAAMGGLKPDASHEV